MKTTVDLGPALRVLAKASMGAVTFGQDKRGDDVEPFLMVDDGVPVGVGLKDAATGCEVQVDLGGRLISDDFELSSAEAEARRQAGLLEVGRAEWLRRQGYRCEVDRDEWLRLQATINDLEYELQGYRKAV